MTAEPTAAEWVQSRCYECDGPPARYAARLLSSTAPMVKLCVDCAADARDTDDVVWIVGLRSQGPRP